MEQRQGVLPSQSIRALIAEGRITAGKAAMDAGQVQPASLDLRLGERAWRVRASFLAGKGRRLVERIGDFEMHSFPLAEGAVLEKGCVYLVPLMERLDLPDDIHAVANAKSSTGRLDILTRLITDDGSEFDRVAPGYSGPLYAEICPRSFSVLVRPGMRLNQIRFRRGDARLADEELRALMGVHAPAGARPRVDNGLAFSVDLEFAAGGARHSARPVVGYRARAHAPLIDLSRVEHYDPDAFWEPVRAEEGRLVLDPGAFYILVSRESVVIPPEYAAEMAPYLAMVGEFRVHYAGFFDPGFGHESAGGRGARGVLEVRCHEVPFVLEHGQEVGRLVFERMTARPDRLYGADLGSNYQGQGLRLSKHFRVSPP